MTVNILVSKGMTTRNLSHLSPFFSFWWDLVVPMIWEKSLKMESAFSSVVVPSSKSRTHRSHDRKLLSFGFPSDHMIGDQLVDMIFLVNSVR